MPSRASYELKIEGLLNGAHDTGPNTEAIAKFKEVFPEDPRNPGPKASWVPPFILDGYGTCLWKSNWYNHSGGQATLLSFRAEVSIFLQEALYDPGVQTRLLSDVNWFYTYKKQEWYTDPGLSVKLPQLNADIAKIAGINVLELARFREWKWYCGNGGGE